MEELKQLAPGKHVISNKKQRTTSTKGGENFNCNEKSEDSATMKSSG